MKEKVLSVLKRIKRALLNVYDKAHTKFRKRFPKKPPKYYDGKLHDRRYLVKLAIISFFIYLYIEVFARITIGPFEGFLYLFRHPVIFFYNCLIIFTTLTLALFFRRRGFAVFMLSLFWILIGTANGGILLKRMTPFTLYDMQNLEDGMSLLTTYFSRVQIIMAVIAVAVLAAIIVLYFIGCLKWQNINRKKALGIFTVSFAVTMGSTFVLIHTNTLSTFFGNLNYAYNDYGVPYCFINTSLNTGISKPDGYSEESMTKILEEDTTKGTNTTLETKDDDQNYPNVIILQMESFTQAQDYNNIEVSTDPTPVFNSLMENYSSGWFEVPACGAGTANTEFEVLTGISSKFFGPGEYPYKGKLRDQALENMTTVFKSHGFSANAMHNHRGLFYNRNEVYDQLGFESFTSLEYMNNITKTPTNWCKDSVMLPNIQEIMESTESRDFMHIISVQGHGAYPTQQVFKDPYVTVSAKNEETRWKYEYYFNEMHEMDTFIGDLIDQLEASGEPTVLLIYGDHIPALDVKESDYANGDLYQTHYVLWDNIGLEKQDMDLDAYRIGAVILERIGMAHEGVIFDYQQTKSRDEADYTENLKALAYDMLYGDNFIFGGSNPYKAAGMRMGFKEISISGITQIGDNYYITGKNFTDHSTVSLDGEVLNTVYLSPTLLGLQESVDPEDVSKLTVSQIDTKDDTILSTINGMEEL